MTKRKPFVRPDLPTRFWGKVDKSGECWLWTAAQTSTGYGIFAVWNPDTRTNRMWKAHRLAYEIAVGPIPEGASLDHLCHTPLCVNPDHLRPTTHKQNLENRAAANSNSTTGVRGVHWSKRISRFVAQVKHEGVTVFSRNFLTIAEAEAAVIEQRNLLFTHNDTDRT